MDLIHEELLQAPVQQHMDLVHEELLQATVQQHMNNTIEQLVVQQAQIDQISLDVQQDRVNAQASITNIALSIGGGVDTT
eukprot:10851426-Heterocapsa_arctica.AAC.1